MQHLWQVIVHVYKNIVELKMSKVHCHDLENKNNHIGICELSW